MTYRKKKEREFFKIDGDTITRVLNKHYGSLIETTKNPIIKENAIDPSDTKECSEQEFKEAFSTAFDRVSVGRIL